MAFQLGFDIAVIVAVVWFWTRRTRPALHALRAEPRALRIGLAATIGLVVAVGLHAVALVAGTGELAANALRLLGGFVWIVVVGLGHPEYRFLRHATGTKPPGA